MDSVSGANFYALAAHLTFVTIYVCYIVGHGNSFKRALFGTLATTYAGCCAGFACYGTFVFVYTAYIYATAFGAFLAQLYNVARAGFHAGTTCGTFIYIYNRQPGSDVECERTELTGCYAIAASETSESACGFAGVKAVDDGTTVGTFVDIYPWTIFARAVATYYSNAWGCIGSFHA